MRTERRSWDSFTSSQWWLVWTCNRFRLVFHLHRSPHCFCQQPWINDPPAFYLCSFSLSISGFWSSFPSSLRNTEGPVLLFSLRMKSPVCAQRTAAPLRSWVWHHNTVNLSSLRPLDHPAQATRQMSGWLLDPGQPQTGLNACSIHQIQSFCIVLNKRGGLAWSSLWQCSMFPVIPLTQTPFRSGSVRPFWTGSGWNCCWSVGVMWGWWGSRFEYNNNYTQTQSNCLLPAFKIHFCCYSRKTSKFLECHWAAVSLSCSSWELGGLKLEKVFLLPPRILMHKEKKLQMCFSDLCVRSTWAKSLWQAWLIFTEWFG